MKFRLVSGEQRHRQFPDTFEIPDADDRRSLAPGDEAKLLFQAPRGTERMWVKVERVQRDGSYTGVLDNTPALLDAQLGDTVRFGPQHVIDIVRPRDVRNSALLWLAALGTGLGIYFVARGRYGASSSGATSPR